MPLYLHMFSTLFCLLCHYTWKYRTKRPYFLMYNVYTLPYRSLHFFHRHYFGSRCAKSCTSPLLSFLCVLLLWWVVFKFNWLSAVVGLFYLPRISHFILRRLVASDKPLHEFWATLVLSTCWRYRGRWDSPRVRGGLGASWHSSWDSIRTHCKA